MSLFSTIVFIIVFLQVSTVKVGSNILEPEKLQDLFVEPCFETEHLKVLYPQNSLGSLFSIGGEDSVLVRHHPVCLTARTDKNEVDWTELQDTGLFVSISTRVKFRITELANCDVKTCSSSIHCDMKFHGHQQVYRLSPDFGYYKSCNSMLSKYWHQVRQHINKDKNNPDKSFRFAYEKTCPLSELPLKYEYQVACVLKPNSWYMVEYHSLINLDYQNHSTKSLNDHQALLVRTVNPIFHLTDKSFPRFMGPMNSVFLEKLSIENNCGVRVHIHRLRHENVPFDLQFSLKLKYLYTTAKNMHLSDRKFQTDEQTSIINIAMDDAAELLYEIPAQNDSIQIFSLEACHKTFGNVKLHNGNVTAVLSEENYETCKLFNFHNCTLRAIYAESHAMKMSSAFLVLTFFLILTYLIHDTYL